MSSDVDIRQQINIRLEVNWYGFSLADANADI